MIVRSSTRTASARRAAIDRRRHLTSLQARVDTASIAVETARTKLAQARADLRIARGTQKKA